MNSIFTLLGGLGLFLYGNAALSRSVQQLAGAKIKNFIRSVTVNRFAGVFVGTITTAVVQASSVTTVMVVSFVNAGFMALPQAISIILGAHIGTTVTAQLIAFDISYLALPIIAIGAFIHLFSRSERFTSLGEALFGFGILFLGLNLMTEAFEPLRNEESVQYILQELSYHPIKGFLMGMILTMLVQSSTVTTAITMALALSSLITFEQAVPLILGENVGTTITANIIAFTGSITAKQAARAHFIINAVGAILGMIFLQPFIHLVKMLSFQADVARQIANAHTFFNILTTIIFLPFIRQIAATTRFLISAQTEKEDDLYYLEKSSLTDPGVALDQAHRALIEMLNRVVESIHILSKAAQTGKESALSESKALLKKIEMYHHKITEYLEQIMGRLFSQQQVAELQKLVRMLHEIERIQDQTEKLREVSLQLAEENRSLHQTEKKEIHEFFEYILRIVKDTIQMLTHNSKQQAQQVMDAYDRLKTHRDALRRKSNERYSTQRTAIAIANYYNDIISALEEVGKKCRNIARIVLK